MTPDPNEPLHLVCVLYGSPSPFDDNVRDTCTKCGRDVQRRPHTPRECIVICLFCYQAILEDGEEVQRYVSLRTIEELRALRNNEPS